MKRIYIRECYYERDDWACKARERFVLEVKSLNEGKLWIEKETLKWEKEGKKRIFSIVECDETEHRIKTIIEPTAERICDENN